MKLFIIYFAIGLGYWILILVKDFILRKLLGEHKTLLDVKVGLFLTLSLFQIIIWPIEIMIDIYIIIWCEILKRGTPWWVSEAVEGMDTIIEEGTKED